MGLYLVKAKRGSVPGFETAQGVVIHARNEKEAREFAAVNSLAEVCSIWLNPNIISCTELHARGEPEVILRSENWG